MKLFLFGLALGILSLTTLQAYADIRIAAGTLSATEVEANEGYFLVGTGDRSTFIVLHPKSDFRYRLKEVLGRNIELIVRVVE